MASEGEGYGLPLIEAAHYGLSIVSRRTAAAPPMTPQATRDDDMARARTNQCIKWPGIGALVMAGLRQSRKHGQSLSRPQGQEASCAWARAVGVRLAPVASIYRKKRVLA